MQIAHDRLPGWIDGFDCRSCTAETRYRRRCDLLPASAVDREALRRWREDEGGLPADVLSKDACPKRRHQVLYPQIIEWLDDYGDWAERGGWRGPPGHIPSQPARWLLAQRVIAGEVARILRAESAPK